MTTTNESATLANVASPLATGYSTGWTPSGSFNIGAKSGVDKTFSINRKEYSNV